MSPEAAMLRTLVLPVSHRQSQSGSTWSIPAQKSFRDPFLLYVRSFRTLVPVIFSLVPKNLPAAKAVGSRRSLWSNPGVPPVGSLRHHGNGWQGPPLQVLMGNSSINRGFSWIFHSCVRLRERFLVKLQRPKKGSVSHKVTRSVFGCAFVRVLAETYQLQVPVLFDTPRKNPTPGNVWNKSIMKHSEAFQPCCFSTVSINCWQQYIHLQKKHYSHIPTPTLPTMVPHLFTATAPVASKK